MTGEDEELLRLIRFVQQRKMHPQPMGGDSPEWLLERWRAQEVEIKRLAGGAEAEIDALIFEEPVEVVPDRVRDRVRADRATVEPDEAPS